jgi:hypothetical protein
MASNKTVLTNAQKAKRSHAFGSELAERPHTLSREEDDLRSDVESAFLKQEQHLAGPVIYFNNIVLSNGDSKLNADGSAHGTSLLCGQTQASVTINDLKFTVRNPGIAGNSLSVVIEQGGAGLAVAVANSLLTITLANGGSSNSDIANAINAEIESNIKFSAEVLNGAGGNNAVIASQVSASGGIGAGIDLIVKHLGDSDSLIADALVISDSLITLDGDQTAITAQPAVGSMPAIIIKNNDNGALSNISQLAPTVA